MREDGEPDQHDRAEDAADEGRSFPLDEEEDHQDGDRDAARSDGASCGASTFKPSTALSTEIAGVIAPSP